MAAQDTKIGKIELAGNVRAVEVRRLLEEPNNGSTLGRIAIKGLRVVNLRVRAVEQPLPSSIFTGLYTAETICEDTIHSNSVEVVRKRIERSRRQTTCITSQGRLRPLELSGLVNEPLQHIDFGDASFVIADPPKDEEMWPAAVFLNIREPWAN